jgi:hypothetical protein
MCIPGVLNGSGIRFQVPCYEVVSACFTVGKWNVVAVKNPVDANALFVKFRARLTDLE